MKQIFILRGEGIECEKESFRFFSYPQLLSKPRYLNVPELLDNPEKLLSSLNKGDWVLFPGGFSFADHLGSGRMLSFKLFEKGIYQEFLKREVHMLGICNGFQILASAGLFGKNISLEKNRPSGFRNQWVKLKGWDGQDFFFTCRHGEGRLQVEEGKLEAHVRAFLHYNDKNFENGSFQKIAGLVARHGESRVVGLMPHPEISLRAIEGPDFVGPEHPGEFAYQMEAKAGQGVQFFNDLVQTIKEGRF